MTVSAVSEFENMIAGRLYRAHDPELVRSRQRARAVLARYNSTPASFNLRRYQLLEGLFAQTGDNIEIEPPFHCDYGWNIHIGNNVYFNTGCVILDCARVRIGDSVLFGPSVHLYAATHPTDPRQRRAFLERAEPITIDDGAWIGGGSIVLPGITIGKNSTIGAGSVVTRDIPANVVAAGNPCRVIRSLA